MEDRAEVETKCEAPTGLNVFLEVTHDSFPVTGNKSRETGEAK